MEIKVIDQQSIWDEFVTEQNYNTFLHSSGWIEFNQRQQYPSWQLGLYENGVLVSVALVLKIKAKRGTFLFIPHGPQSTTKLQINESTGKERLIQEMACFLEFLKELAKKENCAFIRIQPILPDSKISAGIYQSCGFRPAPIHMHTELSTVLDITPDMDNVLLNMRKTTRQMVKKGLKLIQDSVAQVEILDSITDELYDVYQSTYTRGNFVPYSRQYLQHEYESFKEKEKVQLTAIRHNGQILSWGMVLVAGKRAFYHQGANILSKTVPASYMCQFEGIRFAKSQGCISYDFWGVAPKDQPNHPWVNISLFKRGFGGEDTQLLHAQDFPLSWKYWPNWLVETYRAKKRGFYE